MSIVIYIDLQVKLPHGHFLTLGSLFATSIGNPINMNSLTTWPNPTGLQLASSMRESYAQRLHPNPRPFSQLIRCHCSSPTFRDRPAANFSPCDHPFSSGMGFSLCNRPSLPQCKTPSLRRESTKRSACLHPSQVSKRLARPSRTMRRYDLGFLWGLWLPVAVQNIIRNSPQGMPSAERSFISSCPIQAAGAIA